MVTVSYAIQGILERYDTYYQDVKFHLDRGDIDGGMIRCSSRSRVK